MGTGLASDTDTPLVNSTSMPDDEDGTTIRHIRRSETRTDLTPEEINELAKQVRNLQEAVDNLEQVSHDVRVEAGDFVVVEVHDYVFELKATVYKSPDRMSVRWHVVGIGYSGDGNPTAGGQTPLRALQRFVDGATGAVKGDWTLVEILERLDEELEA